MNRQPHRRQALRVKGRRPDTTDLIAVDRYLGNHRPRRDHLIEYLHRIQDDLGHLPARLLVALADRLRVTPAEVYEGLWSTIQSKQVWKGMLVNHNKDKQ